MTSAYEPWNEARGAEIIAEHDKLEGATLVILHAMQEAFGYVPVHWRRKRLSSLMAWCC